MSEQVDWKVAAWLAKVAEAIDGLPKCNPGYGEFYVSHVEVSFDGEVLDMAIVPDDADGYALRFASPAASSEGSAS